MSEINVDAALRELRKEEGNKRCFECCERGPSYIDMEHSTFVCTTCAGILREFTFKIKGISMATFTSAEIKALKASGGNTGAKKVWLTTFEDDMPKPGDKEAIRRFIQAKYLSKKWVQKKKRASSSSEEESSSESEEDKSSKTKKSSSTASIKKEIVSTGTTNSKKPAISVQLKPSTTIKPSSSKPVTATAGSATSQKKDQDLLDMDFGFGSPPASAPAKAVTPNVANDDDFGFDDFVGAPTTSMAPSSNSATVDVFDFGDFAAATPSVPSQQQQQCQQSSLFPAFVSAPTANSSTQPDFFSGFASASSSSAASQQPPSGRVPVTFSSMSQQPATSPLQQQQQQQFPASFPSMNGPQMGFQQPMQPMVYSSVTQTQPQPTVNGGYFGAVMQPMQSQPQQQASYNIQMMTGANQAPMGFPQQQQFKSTNPFAAAMVANRPIHPPSDDIFGSFT